MKNFFKNHSEAVLISLAIIFLVVVIGFFYATIELVVPQVNRTLVSPQITGSQGFNLAGAATIDYEGIPTSTLPTSSSPASTASLTTPTVASTTATSTSTSTKKSATTTGG